MYVPEPVGLVDYQLDIVVSSLDPGVAQSELYGVQYVLLMLLDLLVKIMKQWDPAVARPPEPMIQLGFCLIRIGVFEDHAESLFEAVATI